MSESVTVASKVGYALSMPLLQFDHRVLTLFLGWRTRDRGTLYLGSLRAPSFFR